MKKAKILLWILTTYLLSALCYLPMQLEKMGCTVGIWGLLRYGFVCMPFFVSAAFLLTERRFGAFLSASFAKIPLKEAAFCGAAALAGLALTGSYSIFAKENLFAAAYPSFPSFIAGSLYLFLTALIEELAWRGFLLKELTAGGKLKAILLTGVIWAAWHLPMWLIRNSLGIMEILPLFCWAMLTAVFIGGLYCLSGNILSAALLHMVFNVFFPAPTLVNIAAAGMVLAAALLCRRTRCR